MSISAHARFALATLAIGGSTLAATTAMTATSAEAHRRVIVRTGFIYRAPLLVSRVYVKPRYIVPVIATTAAVVAVSTSCSVYRWRAETYNSAYWWSRYQTCIGN